MHTRILSLNDLVATVRGRRLSLGLSQAALADQVGVSRQWINAFEGGKPGVPLTLVLLVLDALELQLFIGDQDDSSARGGTDLDDLLEEYGRDD